MEIEVVATTWYTVHLRDEDVQKVKQWIKDHEDNLPSCMQMEKYLFMMMENV